MEIKTKFDIGQKVYWILPSSGVYEVKFDDIKAIHLGGKAGGMYEMTSYATRGENELFDDFDKAVEKALEMQKTANEKALDTIMKSEDKGKKY